jgi:hypothetical protein
MEEVKIGEKTLQSLDLITVEPLLSPNSRYTGRVSSIQILVATMVSVCLAFSGTDK